MKQWEYTSAQGHLGEVQIILGHMGEHGWEAWHMASTPFKAHATGHSTPAHVVIQFKRPIRDSDPHEEWIGVSGC